MSVQRGGGYLTRLLQRSQGVLKASVAPRRKARFESNPGAADGESWRGDRNPAETRAPRLDSQPDTDRRAQAGFHGPQALSPATRGEPGTLASPSEPIAARPVTEIEADAADGRGALRPERDRNVHIQHLRGLMPVTISPRDTRLPLPAADAAPQRAKPDFDAQPETIARRAREGRYVTSPGGEVAGELSPVTAGVSEARRFTQEPVNDIAIHAAHALTHRDEVRSDAAPGLEADPPGLPITPAQPTNRPATAGADPVEQRAAERHGVLNAPPALPVEPAPPRKSAAAAATIHVSIGRIEVRAVTPPQPQAPARKHSGPRPPAMSLADYLDKRRGGGA